MGIKEGIRVFASCKRGRSSATAFPPTVPCQQFPICWSLVNSPTASVPHHRPASSSQSHRTIYELERSISHPPIAMVAPRLAGLLAGLQAIARLQRKSIVQRLRIQPATKQPNRQRESGICVELPTSRLDSLLSSALPRGTVANAQYQAGSTPTGSDWQDASRLALTQADRVNP